MIDKNSLLHRVQMQQIFSDGKTFVDCIPKMDIEKIKKEFTKVKDKPGFDLKAFVLAHYDLPKVQGTDYVSDPNRSIEEHLQLLWQVLKREPDEEQQSTLIPLPSPYIVPGGRFREIYYWDSYFTMLGLKVSGEIEMMRNMVDNFEYLITHLGYIPNGNRSYYVGRSQPPFFALMVNLLQEALPDEPILQEYTEAMELEWLFWNDAEGLDEIESGASFRVVKLNDDSFHLRYWDVNTTPRPESYREDVELAEKSKQSEEAIFRNLRAAAESGWDFSHRWFADKDDFSSIQTTSILPVDLNCLNYYMTSTLAQAYQLFDDEDSAAKVFLFNEMTEQMKADFSSVYWNEELGFFTDYDFEKQQKCNVLTLAGVFPLFFGLATPAQAEKVVQVIQSQFLKTGGLTTSLFHSGQQWDAPNGWAPLQWICYKGLARYGFDELANEIRQRWMNTCEKVYAQTGKMTEKYDVWNENAAASGGEYPNQDGFGWTNGVYLAMKEEASTLR